jgi:dihydroxyacetone kinase-like protein
MADIILNPDRFAAMLEALTFDMEAGKNRLTELDAAIGDGDLGISFSRGAVGIREGLKCYPQDIGQIVMNAGMDFNNRAGSTIGALLGVALIQAGKFAFGWQELDLSGLSMMARAASDAIKQRGKAQQGDKTLLDSLVPAVEALEKAAQEGTGLLDGLQRALAASQEGLNATRQMQAMFGRARWLGERTLDHPDPGAAAICIMLESLVSFLQHNAEQGDEIPPHSEILGEAS